VADSIGRKWQLAPSTLDYAAPERFDLIYVGRTTPSTGRW
jgi:threonyl-tRNA synthetase